MLNNKLTALWLRLTDSLRREEGQDALEYMVIAIVVVTLIYLAFHLLGINIVQKMQQIISNLMATS